MSGRPLPIAAVVAAAVLWMAVAGNLPLWRRLSALHMLDGAQGALFALGMGLLLWAAMTALPSLVAWRHLLKPAVALPLVVSAMASHFMSSYGVVVYAGMVTNVMQTDVQEARALLSAQLITTLL